MEEIHSGAVAIDAATVLAVVLDKIGPRRTAAQDGTTLSEQTALKDLALDSLTVLELIYELEEHYRIVVADDQLLRLQRIGDIVDLVLQAGPAAT